MPTPQTLQCPTALESAERRRLLGGAALLGIVVLGASGCAEPAPAPVPAPAAAPQAQSGDAESVAAVNLRMSMRKLWEEHIAYTRTFIISALASLPDQPAVTARLLRNQDDIGNAIKPFFGDAPGAGLARLLRDHIVIAGNVVAAAKANNTVLVTIKQQEWTANGVAIAVFLSGANPKWARADLERSLQHHLDLTTGQVVARLGANWDADIRSYDDGHAHMLMFADTLTSGIIAQFPEAFV
jgi:hypothetical protein